MPLRILWKQLVFTEFSDATKGDTENMKYVMIILAALVLTACGNNENAETENTDTTQTNSNVSVMFQNMDLNSEGTTFVLTGEATSTDGKIYYVIDQGEDRLIEENTITLEKTGEWTKFEIEETLPESSLEANDPPVITLYGKDANNEMANPNYIPVDLVKE